MKFLKFLIFIFIYNLFSCEEHSQSIESCLNKFTRPITVLEIGINNISYSFKFSKKYDMTSVAMLLGKLPHTYNYCLEDSFDNLVILNPNNLNLEDLKTLGRCEHFDLVIVHGIPSGFKKNHEFNKCWMLTIDLILKLGDITFFEINKDDILLKEYFIKKNGELVSGGPKTDLYKFNIPKEGLDIARWVLKCLPFSDRPRYPILSTFDKKVYFKDDKEIFWHRGINFSTFVMLRGICPCENTLIKNLEAMRNICHNDLIIGNTVIQGKKIVVIDVNDPRWDADVQRCIDAALTVFNGRNYRLYDPEDCYARYRKFLSKK